MVTQLKRNSQKVGKRAKKTTSSSHQQEFDLAAWASTKPTAKRGCTTCKQVGVAGLIRQFMKLIIDGKTKRPLADFHFWLREHHGYGLVISSLYRHMKMCETDLWTKFQDARSR